MKKFMGITLVIIALISVICFTTGTSYSVDPSTATNTENGGGGGGGGTTTWNRLDLRCPDNVTEKTLCDAGGTEQCTAQYCKAK